MESGKSETLAIFMSISDAEIAADLQKIDKDFGAFQTELRELGAMKLSDQSPFQCARFWHLRLVYSYGLSRFTSLPIEWRIYDADLAVRMISFAAGSAAGDSKTGRQLLDRARSIETAAGMTEEQVLNGWESPPAEWIEAGHKMGKLREDAEELTMPFVLQRYRLTEAADLLEIDKPTFEKYRAVGNMATWGSDTEMTDIEATIRDSYRSEYGGTVFRQMEQRAADIRTMIKRAREK